MKQEFNITEWALKNRLKEHEEGEYPPYMFSPIGFGCHVCKYYYVKDDKHMCDNSQYKTYIETKLKEKGVELISDENGAELVDDKGNQIKDPSKWCSNWFLPKN